MNRIIINWKKDTCFTAMVAAALIIFPAVLSFAKPVITDLSINDTVEDELEMDSAVSLNKLDVTTLDGIVTLSGSVNNILAKERAARIAETVKGVRAVVNNINVTPRLLRSDFALRDDVLDAILIDPATESYEVDIQVDDGKVVISGTVDSLAERDICEKVVKGVKGVTSVDNNLIVELKSERPDNEIQSEIERVLKWDEYVDHSLVNVEVENGKVYLTGVVGSAAEKRQARLDAYVIGVKAIDASELKVERWARDEDLRKGKYTEKADTDIRKAIKDALLNDPRVSSFNVVVEVTSGNVTLRGIVDNLKAKRAAAEDARNTVGVVFVKNRLKVRPDVKVSDAKLEQRIINALQRDPFLDRYEIVADAIGGTAYLYGTVDTYYEKFKADDIVSRISGVITVNNNLNVEEDYDTYTFDPYLDDVYPGDYRWYHFEPHYSLKSDDAIKKDIGNELWWSPFVDDEDVNVTVVNGIATLTGTVDSWSEYNASVKNAYEGGAAWVRNELVVLVSK